MYTNGLEKQIELPKEYKNTLKTVVSPQILK